MKEDLPISQPGPLRRRLSSLSSSTRFSSPLRRCQSLPSNLASSSLRRWWQWGLGWFLPRKARDIEVNDDEDNPMLGSQSKEGGFRHMWHKIRSELRRLVVGSGAGTPIKRFSYDSYSYKMNFDDTKGSELNS